jgi:hypothetical protein
MKKFKQLKEQIAMSVATGPVAGMPTASPPEQTPVGSAVMLRRKPHSYFGGKAVFRVSSNAFNKARLGKKKFEHYTSYLGHNDLAQEIREYAMQNKDEPIIIEDELTGAMVYLRYGKR